MDEPTKAAPQSLGSLRGDHTREQHEQTKAIPREPTHSTHVRGGDVSAASAGSGILTGTLSLGGQLLADVDIVFDELATGEEVVLTTNSHGVFAGTVPAGRWYTYYLDLGDGLYLDQPTRAKVTNGKTTSVALTAVFEEAGITFSWPSSTHETGFAAYFFTMDQDIETDDPVITCNVDVEDVEMDCDTETLGMTLYTDQSFFDWDGGNLQVLIVPDETDSFLLYDIWIETWEVAPVVLRFSDTMGELDVDLSAAAQALASDDELEYSFVLSDKSGQVGWCYIQLVEGDLDWQECGGAIRTFEDGAGTDFLVPAGTYQVTFSADGAKDVVVKKVAITAGGSKHASAAFVPNTVSVAVTGTGSSGASALLTVYSPSNWLVGWNAANVIGGTATFTWVPTGFVIVEVLNDDLGTYADVEKAYTGGALKLKAALK
ncbi:MAG TPA: hypothetical protein VM370_00945 [Candidatus Thermoplasmatota archaeon]|nr:hypothetical protein [Candidatus Thermoplasmatota archaeon]